MPQLTYKCNDFITTNNVTELPEYGDLVTINHIKYTIVSVDHRTVYLELYSFPTTLSHYLLLLCHISDDQYVQWLGSLGIAQIKKLTTEYAIGAVRDRRKQLASYCVSYAHGTLVYCHRCSWYATNRHVHATAKAATLAELLNSWAAATDHVHYDLLD
jgi:hypothetical protein